MAEQEGTTSQLSEDHQQSETQGDNEGSPFETDMQNESPVQQGSTVVSPDRQTEMGEMVLEEGEEPKYEDFEGGEELKKHEDTNEDRPGEEKVEANTTESVKESNLDEEETLQVEENTPVELAPEETEGEDEPSELVGGDLTAEPKKGTEPAEAEEPEVLGTDPAGLADTGSPEAEITFAEEHEDGTPEVEPTTEEEPAEQSTEQETVDDTAVEPPAETLNENLPEESGYIPDEDPTLEVGSHHALEVRLEDLESPMPGEFPQDEEGEEEEEFDAGEYEQEEEEETQFDRDQLIENYHRALAERDQIQQQNHQLQHKLAEYFRKKKTDEIRQEPDKNTIAEQEQRYLKYMANVDELRRQEMEEREAYRMAIEEYKERCEEKQERVDEETDKFIEYKKFIASNAINSRSGKPISPKDIDLYLSTEMKKEAEVVSVRLENIKLKNKLKKKESQLKSKEELAEGLHLIDFEQLKIENQTYNEKIEERNEELLKLRRKITNTVQVLTHLKEKLQFVQAENQKKKLDLFDKEDETGKQRDKLTRTKQARDRLRIDNQRLRQTSGLLGNEPLLRDFEHRKDESSELKDRLEKLQIEHAELTLSSTGVKKKIQAVEKTQSRN